MTASVSTLARSIGATSPSCLTNFSIFLLRGFLDRFAGFLDVLAHALHGIAAGQDHHAKRNDSNGYLFHGHLHQSLLRTSTKCPAMAAAAAMAGLTRCVRPPGPCRPSKLRLEVDAQRSPGDSKSSFMPRHIEQPGWRHSNPAAVNILSRPSFSACSFTRPEPGTTMASLMFDAMCLPL